MLLLDKHAWMHSLKCFLASMLALYLSLSAELSRPYWAMATAYIVMQPVMGGTRSRGIYRILGTGIGVAGVLVMAPNLLHEPTLLSVAMCSWLSICLFISMLKRGPSSYIFMLAGYSVAFIGFPTVTQPDLIFDVAIARAQEIILGSLCAVVVSAVVFPASIKPMVSQRVRSLMGDSLNWSLRVLERQGPSMGAAQKLAGELAQLDLIIPFAKRDDPRNGDLGLWLEELRACLLGLLPVLASIEDRLNGLDRVEVADEDLKQLIAEAALWIREEKQPSIQSLDGMRQRVLALRSGIQGGAPDLLRESLLLRLKELAEIWYDCLHLQHAINAGEAPPEPAFGLGLRGLVTMANRHVDWGMTVFRALAPGVTLLVYCMLWIRIGWPGGDLGAMMAAVVASFFAAQDDPVSSMLGFLKWGAVGIFFAGLYQFGLFPVVHHFLPLVLGLAPTLLCMGLLLSRPALFSTGMAMLVNFCTVLAIQNHFQLDFDLFANNSISVILGMTFAVIVTRVFRSVGAEVTAGRLLRQAWRLLADAAEGKGSEDRDLFLVRMLDLLGLLAPRFAALPKSSDLAGADVLVDVRMGLNILNLRRARSGLPALSRAHINRLLRLVGEHYREQSLRARAVPPTDELRERLDASLRRLQMLPGSAVRDEALLGLVGLRQGLYASQAPA